MDTNSKLSNNTGVILVSHGSTLPYAEEVFVEIKEKFSATSRCMPFDQTPIDEVCVCCGKPARKLIYFAKAY